LSHAINYPNPRACGKRAPPAMHYKQFGISSVASDLMLHRNLTGL